MPFLWRTQSGLWAMYSPRSFCLLTDLVLPPWSLPWRSVNNKSFCQNHSSLWSSLSHLYKLRPRYKPIKKIYICPVTITIYSQQKIFIFFNLNVFLAAPRGLWELSFRYHTHAPVSGSGDSQPLDHQEFPENLLLNHFNFSSLCEITIRFCIPCYRNWTEWQGNEAEGENDWPTGQLHNSHYLK